ncbi:hypothetical protein BU26DRAFT_56150 [Trematosphaeria pertusa]|uniref:Uncharacterized protein n=1 Tax=Trematosphaeria pertusa TaxID=390896 RepID=A0A6A6IA73_9PLEO|nr:uncharacterized protein BU26DRAFT_56150 [Trematosphaeria pertusa]KAF2246958.1 hypothetical protein BU26DRAFT_56150 [Trematosphaeria pertusa]
MYCDMRDAILAARGIMQDAVWGAAEYQTRNPAGFACSYPSGGLSRQHYEHRTPLQLTSLRLRSTATISSTLALQAPILSCPPQTGVAPWVCQDVISSHARKFTYSSFRYSANILRIPYLRPPRKTLDETDRVRPTCARVGYQRGPRRRCIVPTTASKDSLIRSNLPSYIKWPLQTLSQLRRV